jgi:hypothetical protein
LGLIDAVGDDGGLPDELGAEGSQAGERGLRDGGNGISGNETLMENDAVEEDTGIAEVFRAVVWVEVVKRDDDWTRKAGTMEGDGVGGLDDIGLQGSGQARQLLAVPEIASRGRRASLCQREMKARVGLQERIDARSLPCSDDEVDALHLLALQEAVNEVDGVPGDAVRTACGGDRWDEDSHKLPAPSTCFWEYGDAVGSLP